MSIGFFAIGSPQARAADHIRVATLKTGTLAWELEVVRAHGLDVQANLTIDVIEFASTEAGDRPEKGARWRAIVSAGYGSRANVLWATI